MTTRMIYGSSATLAAIVVVASILLLSGGNSGVEAQAVHTQGPRPVASSSESREKDHAVAAASTTSPTVEYLHRETRQPAHVESYERTDVHAKASGFLKSVLVDIGDRVKQDQILAELWIPEMEQELRQKVALVEQAGAAVEQARARLATAEALVAETQARLAESKASIAANEAEVEFRRSEHGRIVELVRSRSVNEAIQDEKLQHLRSAEAALAAGHARVQSMQARVTVEQTRQLEAKANLIYAQSQLKVAEADREQTAVLMQYARIRAPYDGLITRRWIDSGDFVASAAVTKSEPLLTIERVDKLRIVFDLPESESGLVAVGQLATLRVDALENRAFEGRVQRTAGVLDPKTRTLRVEAELDEPSSSLRPGMYGMITVTLADVPQAVLLPTRCIQFENQSPFVFLSSQGVVEKRAVELGYSDGARTQVTQGLGPLDLVVINADAVVGSEKSNGTVTLSK